MSLRSRILSKMKNNSLTLLFGACGLIMLAGCAGTPTRSTALTGAQQTEDVRARKSTYTQEELQKRGGPQLSDSLEKQDASVRISGGR